MKTFLILTLVAMTSVAEAKIGLKVSLIYKKGIGRGFFLSTEQHTINSVFENEKITIQMSNGIKTNISAHFVQSVHEYGPSGFLRVEGNITGVNGKVVKKLDEPKLDVYLGQTKTVLYKDGEEEEIEVQITPVSL